MRSGNLRIFGFALVAILISGCSKDSNNSQGAGGNSPDNPTRNRVNWEGVSSDFNPRVDDYNIQTQAAEKINLDLFGFSDDVEVLYSKDIPMGLAALKVYKVWKKQASWGNLDQSQKGNQLDIRYYGSYQCSIRIRNGQISELEGGCIVRAQLTLNPNAEIEVYNIGKLISKRFFPMDNEAFFRDLDRASFAKDKWAVIENYLHSYKVTGKSPALKAEELGEVIDQFIAKEDKFKVLRMLHSYVTDRGNLAAMIEAEFGYFDREEARRIVGL